MDQEGTPWFKLPLLFMTVQTWRIQLTSLCFNFLMPKIENTKPYHNGNYTSRKTLITDYYNKVLHVKTSRTSKHAMNTSFLSFFLLLHS